jgi:hypothetical protein
VNMKRVLFYGLFACGLLGVTAGCGKKNEATLPAQGMATQGATAEAASTYADANLTELTRELRRWIVATKKRPTSFEDFVANAKITVPPAPAGKKYSLSKEMRVELVDR